MKNYRHIYREKRSLVNCEAHLRQYLDHRDILGSTHNYAFLYSHKGMAEELHRDIDNQKWHRLGKKLLQRKFFKKLLEDGRKTRVDLKSFVFKLKRADLSKSSDRRLIDLFLKACSLHSRTRGYFKTSRPEFQAVAETKFKEVLFKKYSNAQSVQKIFQTLTTPVKFDEINQEFFDWINLLSKPRANITKLIFKHIDRYPWLVAQSYSHKEIIKTFFRKYHNDVKRLKLLRQEVKSLKREKRRLALNQQMFLKEFRSKDIGYLSWLFQQSALERMRLKGGWAGSDFLYFPLYDEISRRTKVAIKDLYSFYRIGEVIKAIKNHRPTVTRTELVGRRIAYVLWLKKGKLLFFSGKQANKVIEQELKHIKKKMDDQGLTGQVASSGIARGRVRIVLPGNLSMLKQSLHDFKKGDVMVVPMTQPNMTSFMKKAVAIVTDEGGLISHAAIMAREFKTPCIVGTEIATKIFKDGDLVEVDANKGIVKKI